MTLCATPVTSGAESARTKPQPIHLRLRQHLLYHDRDMKHLFYHDKEGIHPALMHVL